MATMTTFVALLRGVNVTGHKPIAMTELRKSCEALGLAAARTYLQSGNLVFAASRTDPGRLSTALAARIADDFGHDVQVLVLEATEVGALPPGIRCGRRRRRPR